VVPEQAFTEDFAQCGQQAVETSIFGAGIQSLSGLRPRKSGISGLPKMALGAISLAIRAAIDIFGAVRAGRQRV
jgi:hypothetical protein